MEKSRLLQTVDSFKGDFQQSFIDHFVELTQSYMQTYTSDILEEVAERIYENIFSDVPEISKYDETLFCEMREEGVMIGFLINRSVFYVLEKFVQSSEVSKSDIKDLITHLSHFLAHFEGRVCDKYRLQSEFLDFNFYDSVSLESDIFKKLRNVKENNSHISFFNLYNGVPISNVAKVVHIDGEEVVFETEAIQEIAMKMEGVAYILKDDIFDRHIKADIVFNDFLNHTVTLKNFSYMFNMPATQRQYIRVHPDISALVTLHENREKQTIGKLYDISLDGLGVVSHENNGLYAGAKTFLHFMLGDKQVSMHAEVLNIIEYTDSYRYCLKSFHEGNSKEIIVNYVKTREKEIYNSLKEHLKEFGI